MSIETRNIGLCLGADLCWPAAFEELLKTPDLGIPHHGKDVRIPA